MIEYAPMNVVTPSEMRELDRLTIGKYKVPALALMENAGRAVADQALTMLGGRAPGMPSKVCVLCGPGNNGGDGFVAARLLHEQGTAVSVFLLARAAGLKNEARINWRRAEKSGRKVLEVISAKGLAALVRELATADLVIDAIFGTGFRGAPDKLAADAIAAVNVRGAPVLAVDIPSGVNGETGAAAGAAIRADRTVTMGLAKTGLLFHPGKSLAGDMVVADIGLPQKLLEGHGFATETLEHPDAARLLPQRLPDAHKGSCGTVVVLAGSLGFTGAAALAARTALCSGAGMAYLGVPESLHDILAVKLTEVIIRPLPETRTRTISIHALERIRSLFTKADALAIGPGLSTHPETVDLIQQLLPLLPVPAVIDADALNALSQRIETLGTAKVPLILTPHYGELSRLLQVDIQGIRANPLAAAREATKRFRQVVVLKGAPSVVAEPSGRVWINTTGNAGMATAGTGDVLTGLIAGLLAQGLKPAEAARLGVFLHGMSGDIAAGHTTEYCLLASDLADHLPLAYQALMEGSR